ncbi:CPSF A subunit region-domain-containing protein, partial [Cladochytrium replicatum]
IQVSGFQLKQVNLLLEVSNVLVLERLVWCTRCSDGPRTISACVNARANTSCSCSWRSSTDHIFYVATTSQSRTFTRSVVQKRSICTAPGQFENMAGTLYSYYKELIPPSCIETCAEARFTSPTATNLIVTKGSLLEIYNVVEEDAPEVNEFQQRLDDDYDLNSEFPRIRPLIENAKRGQAPKIAKLELRSRHKLQGNVTSIGVVRTANSAGASGMDSLLLSFKEAKMALIEYNPATNNIVTVSIHYYEREEFKKESLSDRWIPEIRVDPQSRCAIMNFYNDRFAIIPMKQDLGDTDNVDASSKHPYYPSYVISFSSIDPKIRSVVDVVFLHDYYEPTLAILYETTQTWTGRLVAKADTKSLIVVSLDLEKKAYPVLYSAENLPYNCYKLCSIPAPVRGILVFSPNAIMYLEQTNSIGVCVAVNMFHGAEKGTLHDTDGVAHEVHKHSASENSLYSQPRMSDFRHLGLSLDGSVHSFVNPDTLLLVLRSGEMVIVELIGSEDETAMGWRRKKGGVREFRVKRLALRANMPYCIARLTVTSIATGSQAKTAIARKEQRAIARGLQRRGSALDDTEDELQEEEDGYEGLVNYGYLFLGSRTSDSLLLQYIESENLVNIATNSHQTSPTLEAKSAPDPQLDDDDEDLYGESSNDKQIYRGVDVAGVVSGAGDPSGGGRLNYFRFRLCDTLLCTGPIRDLVVGESVPMPESQVFEYQSSRPHRPLEIVTVIGEGVAPDNRACTSAVAGGALGIMQQGVRPLIVMSKEHEFADVTDAWAIRCSHIKRERSKLDLPSRINETLDDDDRFHDYLVLSKPTGTLVLRSGEEFQKIEGNNFHAETPTVGVGTVSSETMIVQVHLDGMVLLNAEGDRLHDLALGNGRDQWVVYCSIVDPYILVMFNDGALTLVEAKASSKSLSLCHELKSEDNSIMACCLYTDDTSGALFPSVGDLIQSKSEELAAIASLARRSSASGALPGLMVLQAPKRRKKSKRKSGEIGKGVDLERTNKRAKVRKEYPDDEDDIYGDDSDSNEEAATVPSVTTKAVDSAPLRKSATNDDDLYGEDSDGEEDEDEMVVDSIVESKEQVPTAANVTEENVSGVGYTSIGKPTYWCVLYRENGTLEVLSVPDFEQQFCCPSLNMLPNILTDRHDEMPGFQNNKAEGQGDRSVEISEIFLANIGRDAVHKDPYLLLRSENGDLYIYKGFTYVPTQTSSDSMQLDSAVTPVTPVSLPSASATTPIFLSVVSSDGDAQAYYTPTSTRLAVRFQRVPLEYMAREQRSYADTEGDKLHPVDHGPKRPTLLKRQYFRPFSEVAGGVSTYNGTGDDRGHRMDNGYDHSGLPSSVIRIPTEGRIFYSGVFMSGPRPLWIMAAGTGGTGPQLQVIDEDPLEEKTKESTTPTANRPELPNLSESNVGNAILDPPVPVSGKRILRVHPMHVDGDVKCFTTFHNVNCPFGFLYFNGQGTLRICQLPPQFAYDMDWPFHKVPLRGSRTARSITYHYESNTYVMTTTTPIPFSIARAQHAAAVMAGVIEDSRDEHEYILAEVVGETASPESKQTDHFGDNSKSGVDGHAENGKPKHGENDDEQGEDDIMVQTDVPSGPPTLAELREKHPGVAFGEKGPGSGGGAIVGMTENGTEIRKKPPIPERPPGQFLPEINRYQLELVSPVTWETVDVITVEEYEHITCLASVRLESKQTTSGRKLFLAIGTGVVRGEDLSCRGRVILFEIIEVVPEPDNPQTNHKMKILLQNEEKGPVTAIGDVNGYLVAAIGQKIIIHSYDGESLVGVAFIDVNIYVHSITSVKNVIMIGDIYKSVWLLAFQDEPPKLVILGKDYYPLQVISCEFLIDESNLGLLVTDVEMNAHIFSYAPYNVQSAQGNKLIRKGDMHIGAMVTKMARLRRVDEPTRRPDGTIGFVSSKQFFSLLGTSDGGVAVMCPVTEKIYKRLYALYSKMVDSVQPIAGLNPRAFRQIQHKTRPQYAGSTTSSYSIISSGMGGMPGARSILDGDYLHQYISTLSSQAQAELAGAIGTEKNTVMDDLLEVLSGVEHF